MSIGRRVRVPAIDARIAAPLPAHEARGIDSLIGEALEVVGLGDGVAFVEKTWQRGCGRSESHRIPLWPMQMALVETPETR